MSARCDVAIIGAGLMGSCMALALAERGVGVTLIERDGLAMNRASLRNEGKIHLGLIYAAEAGRVTARLQLQGALRFAPLLRRWGVAIDAVPLAAPFVYLVEAASLRTPDALAGHFALLEAEAAEIWRAEPGLDYLGTRPARFARPMDRDEIARWFVPDRFLGAFETAELALDTEALARAVRAALAARPEVRLLTGHDLRGVARRGGGFALEGDLIGQGGVFRLEAGQVVNASWENLLHLDRMAGLEPAPGWLHRLKYRVLARLPERLEAAPSSTMVLGPYGDVVVRPGGLSYLSWYPTGLRGWTDALAPPDDWAAPMRGEVDPATAADVAAKALAAIDAWFPGAAGARVAVVDAGAILAHGRTDVDDPDSGLHGRAAPGLVSLDGWHSMNTGKLTTAPMMAEAAAEVLAAGVRAGPAGRTARLAGVRPEGSPEGSPARPAELADSAAGPAGERAGGPPLPAPGPAKQAAGA